MKKMLVIIVILAIIFIGMIIERNTRTGTVNSVTVEEVEAIQNYISKIYMWKEITKEALPKFNDLNQSDELWVWEVIKKDLEEYEITYEQIEEKAKEIFGEKFSIKFPKEGTNSLKYNKETQRYFATETILDEKEDLFLLDNIEKNSEGYEVKIIEYLEDYSEANVVIIRNLQEEVVYLQSKLQTKVNQMEELTKITTNTLSEITHYPTVSIRT